MARGEKGWSRKGSCDKVKVVRKWEKTERLSKGMKDRKGKRWKEGPEEERELKLDLGAASS